MTVASTTNRVDYTGNGSTTVFSFTFRIFDDADLVVTTADANGVETTLVLDTDYTVTGAGSYSGGSVTISPALASGVALTLQRVLDITQETDLRNQGQFFAETHEDVFDRMVMIGQQLQEQIDRSAKLPVTNTTDAEALVTDIVTLADNLTELTAVYNALSDIGTVADDLNEATSEIEVVAGAISNVNTVGNNITNVGTVAGISANVTTVAGISSNVTTVAGISSAVSGVAAISSAVSAVNSNATNINAVNSNATNINAVAGNETNIDAVAANETNIDTVAGINANVTTVAGISSDVTAVAADATDIGTVATNIADVNTVATDIADINSCADNMAAILDAPAQASAAAASAAAAAASLDNFDDRYLGSKSSAPTLDNDGNALTAGALYFNNGTIVADDKGMYVYDGGTWIAASAASQAILVKYKYLATAGQTTFTGTDANGLTLSYTAGSIIVTLNGVVMDASDYTATTGNSVVLGTAAALNDELGVFAFSTFDIANTYTQSQVDAFAVKLTGDQTVAGVKTFSGATTVMEGNVGIGTSLPTSGVKLDIVSDNTSLQYVQSLRLKTTNTGDYHPSILLENNRNSIANAVKIAMDSATSSGSGELVVATKDSSDVFQTRLILRNNGNLAFNSGYGSVATAYGCRAWVNFNGTGTVAIRASGNVTSITDGGVGLYTVNFTTAMPDVNYAMKAICGGNGSDYRTMVSMNDGTQAVGSIQMRLVNTASGQVDSSTVMVSVHR